MHTTDLPHLITITTLKYFITVSKTTLYNILTINTSRFLHFITVNKLLQHFITVSKTPLIIFYNFSHKFDRKDLPLI